jgi:hypothetical protein
MLKIRTVLVSALSQAYPGLIPRDTVAIEEDDIWSLDILIHNSLILYTHRTCSGT